MTNAAPLKPAAPSVVVEALPGSSPTLTAHR